MTDAGRTLLGELRTAAESQEAELAERLSDADREQLYELLLKLSAAKGLDRDVHPGYRSGG